MLQLIFFLFLVFAVIYLFSIIIYWAGFFYSGKKSFLAQPHVSIVIAIKNEISRLPTLLKCLQEQDYPDDLLEIIIVDNGSQDGSYEWLIDKVDQVPQIKVLSTANVATDYKFKKAALSLGIEYASGDVILTTDADCTIKQSWVSSMASCFNENVDVVAGYSAIQYGSKLFERIQALDFLMLMAAGKSTINIGLAWACSGQNWAFRKRLFEKVGGYKRIRDRVGGDDSLFLQVLRKETRAAVVFNDSPDSHVTTQPVHGISEFLRQRIRWASEANYMHRFNLSFFTVVIATFLANLFALLLPLWFVVDKRIFLVSFIFMLLKCFVEGLLVFKSTEDFNQRDLRKTFFQWFVFQIPYVIFMGVLSFWGNQLRWKPPVETT